MNDECKNEEYFKECVKNIVASYHPIISDEKDNPEQISVKILKRRFEASKKAFVLLYQNNCKYEATIIAGYMFELLASIHQFELGDKTTNDIMGNVAYKYMEILLQYPIDNTEKTMWNEYFRTALDVLKNFGCAVLKNAQKVYEVLEDATISQDIKLKTLGKNYKGKPIQSVIDEFINQIKKIKIFGDNNQNTASILRDFYISYCCFKHNNFLSFLPQNNDISEIVFFLSIAAYYNDFKETDTLLENYKKLFGKN